MATLGQRIALAVLGVCCLVWFSATLGRSLVTYDLFVPGTPTWRQVPLQQRLDQLRLAENLGTLAWSSYALALAATITALVLWRGRIRQHGYIAIAAVLMFVSLLWHGWIAPTELALIGEFPSRWIAPAVERFGAIEPLIVERFFRRSPADLLDLLVAATVIVVLIVQPRRLHT